MERLPFPLDQSLVDNPPKIFEDVKYLVEGSVDPQILKLLENGGAKQLSYVGISSTHMIVGEGANETKVQEADEVFDVSCVQPRWVAFSAKLGKLLPCAGFEVKKRLFSNMRVTSSGLNKADVEALWANVTSEGGHYQTAISPTTTHLVTNQTTSKKYAKGKEVGIKIVSCDYITDCLKAKALLDEEKYLPSLLYDADAVKNTQIKVEPSTTPQTKSGLASLKQQIAKVTSVAASTASVRPQASTILHVQLAGSQPANGPRGRGISVRQQAMQVLVQQKQAPGTPNIRAHRPLLVNIPQQQKTKASVPAPPPTTSQPPPPPVSQTPPTSKPTPQSAQQGQLASLQPSQPQQGQSVPTVQPQSQQQPPQQPPPATSGQQQIPQVPVLNQITPSPVQGPAPSLQQPPNQLQMALQQSHIQQQQQQQQQQSPANIPPPPPIQIQSSQAPVMSTSSPVPTSMQQSNLSTSISMTQPTSINSMSSMIINQPPNSMGMTQAQAQQMNTNMILARNRAPMQMTGLRQMVQQNQQMNPNQPMNPAQMNHPGQQISQVQMIPGQQQQQMSQQQHQMLTQQQMLSNQGQMGMSQQQLNQQLSQQQSQIPPPPPIQVQSSQAPVMSTPSSIPSSMQQSNMTTSVSMSQPISSMSPMIINQPPNSMGMGQPQQMNASMILIRNRPPMQMTNMRQMQVQNQQINPNQPMNQGQMNHPGQGLSQPQMTPGQQQQMSQQQQQMISQQQMLSNQAQMGMNQQQINQQLSQQHPNQLVASQQQQQQSQLQNSQPQQQQQHTIQLQQMTMQQQQQLHHSSQLHQQLQGQLQMQQQQHPQLQIQSSPQLQNALAQPTQSSQAMATQVQVVGHSQQGTMQVLQQQQQHQIIGQQPQQQSVLQNQLQQLQHPGMQQHQPQQLQHLQQQQQHITTLQHSQPGMQQGHQILQQQPPPQGMQLQRPPNQQGHPMHMQQQLQGQVGQMGQPHQGVQIAGMQFNQQMMQQQHQQHQLQLQQQQQQQQQQPRPQGMMSMQQQQQQSQQPQQSHTIQVMQQPQPGTPPTSHSQTGSPNPLQPILSPQQLAANAKFQEIGPSSGQQMQQGTQHYNVVIHQGQQYAQMNPPRPPQRHPGKPPPAPPGAIPAPQQPQMGQPRMGQIPHSPGQQPRPGSIHFTNQQHMEIYRQIHNDPVIKAKWAQMDQQQRQLLFQKLAQRAREEQLRKEMMIRQQQMNQQNAVMQGQPQGQILSQQPQSGVPGSPQQHLVGQPQQQTILVQQGSVPQAAQSPSSDKQMGLQSLIPGNSPTLVSQPAQSPLAQSASPQLQQAVQSGQMACPPIVTTVSSFSPQQMMMQKLQQQQQQPPQNVLNPRAQSPTQKFPSPSPIQSLQTRSPTHSGIQVQQPPQQGTIVRTQQVFTPQVAQHGQPQPQQRMVLVHQGGVPQQQQTRFPQQQIILQQHQPPLPGQPGQPVAGQQKVAILQGPHQSPGKPVQSPGQWMPGTPPPQRLGSPTQSTTQFPPRMQSPDAQQRSPGQVWNVRAQAGSLITPGSPGATSAAPYVQVVNSKTKTALANLLNNRLQGNNTGTDSTTGNALAAPSTSSTLSMCSSPQNLPVPSSPTQQLPLQHPVTPPSSQSMNVVNQRRTLSNLTNSSKTIHQVNSYGNAAARAGSLSQSPTSVAISPTRNSFYGYESSFKAPPNGFFIGCVFWAAQPMDAANWRRCIIQFGGEVLNEYNVSRVTHVLCSNQKFPEFQQVLSNGKRLVTLHWLSDICLRKVMVPPFYAMHLPTSFNDDSLPLAGQAYSVSGFEGEDRERVIKMLKLLGADFTPYFLKLNKGLVACRSDGRKFTKAREWKLPVVNIQFLNELLLGNSSCLQMIHSPKYQLFTLEQPFRFDINIAPHLMAAWKTPIRVANDIVEKFKTGKRLMEFPEDDEERAKRAKYLDTEKLQLSYLTDVKVEVPSKDSDTNSDVENKRPPVVIFIGFCDKFKSMAKDKVISLGGRVTIELKEASHAICWEIPTTKLYAALCKLKHVVGAPWIRDSFKANRFLEEAPYIARVPSFEKYHNTTLAEVLKKPDRHLLFKGITFYMTPGIVGKVRTDMQAIIELGGGQLDKLQKSMLDVRSKCRKTPRKYIVITTAADFEFLSDFFYYKPSKPMSVFTSKFIFNCIADQRVDFPLPVKKTPKVEPINNSL